MAEWQSRPLDRVYPMVFVDAINVKIRDGKVANRPIYMVMAVTVEGTRDILGIWAGASTEPFKVGRSEGTDRPLTCANLEAVSPDRWAG